MKNVNTRATVYQFLAAIVANLSAMVSGMILSWDTPMIPRLTNLTSAEIGWVASFVAVGGVIGTTFGGFFVDIIGRKRMLWYSFIPALLFYIVSAYKLTYFWLSIGHCIGGLTIGLTYMVIQMYLGEIAQNDMRGSISSLASICTNLGYLMSYVLGTSLPSTMFSIVSLLPAIIAIGLFFFIPESPYQLIIFGDTKSAEKSLSWLRGGADVTEELKMIETYVTERQNRKSGLREMFRNKSLCVSVALNLLLSVLMQFCGYLVIMVYADRVLINAEFVISGDHSVIIFGSVVFFTNFLGIFIADWLGRRLLLAISAAMASCLLTVVGLFFQFKYNQYDVTSFTWVPLIVLSIYGFCASTGIVNVAAIVNSETFPTNAKASAMTITLLMEDFAAAVTYKIFQEIEDKFGLHVVFYFHAISTVILTGITLTFLPETKGKSFEDIENDLKECRLCGSGKKTEYSSRVV